MPIDKVIPEAQYFHVSGGPSIPTILALRAYLRIIPQEQFIIHVNLRKNDFANWVRYVFDEPQLADKMLACKTKESLLEVLDSIFVKKSLRSDAIVSGADAALPHSVSGISSFHDAPRKSSSMEVMSDVVRNTSSPEVTFAYSSARAPPSPSKPTISSTVPPLPSSASDLQAPVVAPKVQTADSTDHSAGWPDERFAPIRREMNERNEKIGDKYDEITRRLQSALDDPLSKELEAIAERLMGKYNDLLVRISEERRLGHDMLFPAMMMKQFPAKLTLAKATRIPADFAIADTLLDQIKYAIVEAISSEGVSVKEQVMAMAGLDPVTGKPINQPQGGAEHNR